MKLLYVLALGVTLQACGGGGGPTNVAEGPLTPATPGNPASPAVPVPPDSPISPVPPAPPPPVGGEYCSVQDQQLALQDFMQQQYFWYSQLGTPNAAASTMDEYFQSLLAKPVDRYSYTQSAASFNQVFNEGRRTGYGYTLVAAEGVQPTLRFRQIEPLSPAANAGLQRGDTVLSIDGYTPQQILAGDLPRVSTAGVARKFALRSTAGVNREVTVISADFALDPVASTATLDAVRNGMSVKVGYIAYHQFVSYSLPKLTEAFTRFSEQDVAEVILDLRYNGGGSVATARDLGSMLGGTRTASSVFTSLRFNDKQSARNMRYSFGTSQSPLASARQGLPRIYVIASRETASASELLINGLRPFMDVVLVGETTFGKPYGFVPQYYCDIYYNAVQFDSLNSAGVGGYTAGFAPNCDVADDLDRQLGDPQERRIKAALDYVATGSCPALPQSMRSAGGAVRVLGETVPKQMFAD
jgi:carboxyl-terminal processing protease